MPERRHSCLYVGTVRHRRERPRRNHFRYPLFLAYLDLDEAPELLAEAWLVSAERPAPLRCRREDYLGPVHLPLAEAVRQRVAAETGHRPEGPIRMLTHLRTWGYLFNPVTIYYCFDKTERLAAIVAEITNTPWGERHAYVLSAEAAHITGRRHRWTFDKQFHVSPYMPLAQAYDWRFSEPGEHLGVHMVNRDAEGPLFDATLALARRPWHPGALATTLVTFPLMTLRVIGGIYWQALRLKLKGVPYVHHPHGDRARRRQRDVQHRPPEAVPARP